MNKLYVGNLPLGATEEALRAFFNTHGHDNGIKSIQLIKDRYTGELRGFGFVEYENQTQAQAALQALNSQSFQGKTLKVSIAQERERRSGGGGSGGFSGNRSGGGGKSGGSDDRRRW